MTSGKSKFDQRSKDANRAGSFLRARWQQWLIGRGGVKVSYLADLPSADSFPDRDTSTGRAGAAAKHADSTASRNAQNCTFEVF
jgi:hypothetical protein